MKVERLPLVVAGLASGLVLTSFFLFFKHEAMKGEDITKAESDLRIGMRDASLMIDDYLKRYKPIVDGLAKETESLNWTRTQARSQLEALMEEAPEVFGLGIAYDRCRYPKLFAPFVTREVDRLNYGELQQSYDYEKRPKDFWYHRAHELGPNWVNNWGEVSGDWIAVYSRPVDNPESDCSAVVFMVFTFELIRQWIEALELGKTGYAFLLSSDEKLMVHPRQDYVSGKKSLTQLVEEQASSEHQSTLAVIKKTLDEKAIFTRYEDSLTGQPSWLLLTPIHETGWHLGVVYVTDIIPLRIEALRRVLFLAIACLCLGMAFGAVAIVLGSPAQTPSWRVWGYSVAVSLVFLLGMLRVWHFTYQETIDETGEETTPIANQSELGRFLKNQATDHLIPVGTGLFIETFTFDSAYDVSLTGLIWQSYPSEEDEPGFLMPDAISLEIEERQRIQNDNQTLVISSFSAQLRQQFEYGTYPFDFEVVRIRILPGSPLAQIILVPAFENYPVLVPSAQPGLDSNLSFSGLTCLSSYFSYISPLYNLDFRKQIGTRYERPELSFNLALRRNLLDPLIAHLMPLAVVAFLIFGLLLTVTDNEEKAGLLGFNASGVIAANAALFFVVLVAHIQLREGIKVPVIMYLEYFYFSTYLMLLMATAHSVAFQLGWRLDRSGEARMVKLLYWPFLLGLLLTLTLFRFY